MKFFPVIVSSDFFWLLIKALGLDDSGKNHDHLMCSHIFALFTWAVHMINHDHPLRTRVFMCLAQFARPNLRTPDVLVECQFLDNALDFIIDLDSYPDHVILSELFCKMCLHEMGDFVPGIVATLYKGCPTSATPECILNVFKSKPLAQTARHFTDFLVTWQTTIVGWFDN
jgi:hypothetical protein